MIVNHDQQKIPATACMELGGLAETEDYKAARLIVVEEAQFFADLVPFVLRAVDEDGKNVVVVGLDGDSERRPFGRVLDLVPHADRISKLTSFCRLCSDGTPAIFTHAFEDDARASAAAGKACVGAGDKYMPMCRRHYLIAKAAAAAAKT
jgi:thymidine kinase